MFQTLQLFAFGNYEEYQSEASFDFSFQSYIFLENKSSYLELSPSQVFKLRQLSLLALFQRKKVVLD